MPPPPVKLLKSVIALLNALPPSEREAIVERLSELALSFGQPHRHAGLGIRKLGFNVFEFRASRALRGVFLWSAGELRVELIGNHDQVRAWLKANR